MKRPEQVIALCIATTCVLTLLVLFVSFLFYPYVTWRLLARYSVVVVATELCAIVLGYVLGRVTIAILAEEAEERQTRLRLFLSETGHELRTPLAVMGGTIGTLRQAISAADIAGQSLLDGLEQEINRLSQLVQKVLLLARLDVVRASTIESVDVNATLEAIAEEGRRRSPQTSISVEGPAAVRMSMDRTALREAVRNLVDNALRYAPGAPITLSVVRDAQSVQIVVADEGPGMDAEDCALAFERYYRGSAVGNIDGSGLGLAIVKSTAERFGGRATIDSGIGLGVRVAMAFPAA